MSLLHRIKYLHDVFAWEGDMPTQGRYTAGIAGEKFFREIQENGRFLGTVCTRCCITYVPPRLYCERCFDQLDEWVEVPPTGQVYTFTTVHLDLDGNPLPGPRIMALVQLDGADGGLVHFIGEAEPEDICVGTRVEAVFKDKEERKGGIRDIAYFRPVSTG
jgi:uncharacterized OB-fold protein